MFFILLGLTIILGSAPTLGCNTEDIEDISKFIIRFDKFTTTFGGNEKVGCFKLHCDDSNGWLVCGKFKSTIAVCNTLIGLFKIANCEWTPTATYDDHYVIQKTSLKSFLSCNSWDSTTIPSPRPTPIRTAWLPSTTSTADPYRITISTPRPTTWFPSTTTTADPYRTTITTHRPTPRPSPIP